MRHSRPPFSGLMPSRSMSLCHLGAAVAIAGIAGWSLPTSAQAPHQMALQSLAQSPGQLAVPPSAEPVVPLYQYREGSFTATAQIDPLAGRLLGRLLQKEIPSAVTLSATELAGSFTIPEGAATLANGVITLDATPVKTFLEPYLQAALAQVVQSYNLPDEIGIETLEAVLNYRFVGQGRLQASTPPATAPLGGSQGKRSTSFTFEYSDRTARLTARGIDPAVLALCQVEQCDSQIDGDFDLQIDVQGFSQTSEQLGIELPSSVRQALNQARLFGIREVAFADGQLTSAVQVQPERAMPLEVGAPLTQPASAVLAPQLGRRFPSQSAPPIPRLPDRGPTPGSALAGLTQGNFVLTAERLTAPWSAVFSVSPPPERP